MCLKSSSWQLRMDQGSMNEKEDKMLEKRQKGNTDNLA